MKVYFKGYKLPNKDNALHLVEVDEYSIETAIELVKTEMPSMGWTLKSTALACIEGGKN